MILDRTWHAVITALMTVAFALAGMAFYVAAHDDIEIPGEFKQQARQACAGASDFDSCFKGYVTANYSVVID